MTPANVNFQLGQALRVGNANVKDPGTGGTIDIAGRNFAVGRGWGAGTYKLPNLDAGSAGTVFTAYADAAQTYTSQADVSLATATSGQVVKFEYVALNTWVVVAHTAVLSGVTGHIDIPLATFREVDSDGDVRAAAADTGVGGGGILASDTTPIYEGAGTTNALRLRWASGNTDRIASSVTLPPDFDGTQAVTIGILCSGSGAADAFTATGVTNWDGGADVSDTIVAGGTASTDVGVAVAVVLASDIPDAPMCVAVSITPGTHGTDAFHVYGVRISYAKTLVN
jgi:hypothetical protein